MVNLYRVKNGWLQNTSTDSNEVTFVILIYHASMPIRKKILIPTRKARKGPAEMSLWKRAGCQTMSKAFEKPIVEFHQVSDTFFRMNFCIFMILCLI